MTARRLLLAWLNACSTTLTLRRRRRCTNLAMLQASDLGERVDLVDLMGRLSNPPRVVKTLAEQGSQASEPPRKSTGSTPNRASNDAEGRVPEEKGRLSNLVQRRLAEATVDDLVRDYLAGSSIDSLAAQLGVNRTTIIHHLDCRRIERRKVVRKMTDRSVRQAARHYKSGESLKVVAARFGVDAKTLAREFNRADVPIRRRRGWT
jgi:AraC-like DNA-binding protein